MTALIDLSLARCKRGACANAIPDLQQALRVAHANYTANSVPVGFLDFLLGYAYWKSGKESSAAELMKIGISEMASQLGRGHPTYIAALKQYDSFLTQNGTTAEAAEVGERIANLERSRAAAHSEADHSSFDLNLLR